MMGGGGLEAWVLEESEVGHSACPGGDVRYSVLDL
jgi:hypothetical protein